MPNRLSGETSPYLLQHADNPVDWRPWGEEALDEARREGKPILLSVGYSACHWCHVMAHESFEDPVVAAAMNAYFVNIKVDREERPDIDQIYQAAHALLTRRSGGWPLTMFLTPDGAPFFGGTFFPKLGRFGLPGFLDLLPRVASAYREQAPAIAEQGVQVRNALASLEPSLEGTDALPESASDAVLTILKRRFDPVHGGFGAAPKFPHATDLEFCLRQHARTGDAEALAKVRLTLEAMAEGGIHDQLGGGFCRYSVDAEWTIPHFEKMLYDNGPLLALYADLARVTGDARFNDVAHGIVGWLTREMTAPDGAFYSSLDADSDGEEGKFYVWTQDEVRAVLAPDDLAVAAPYYGLDGAANFEGRAWNLRVTMPLADVAAKLGISQELAAARLAAARAALLDARALRRRPGLDDKILTAWNALAIAGLARAARALDVDAWVDLALSSNDALRRTAWRDGRLCATRKGERAHLNAYLDDYAYLLAAQIELMQARFRLDDYAWARSLAEVLLAQFEDPVHGGFYFTSHDHERLFHRTKSGHDNATPSGNGVAAGALIALGHLCGQPRYVEAGERTLRLFGPALTRSPGGYSSLLTALEEAQNPPTTVLIQGEPGACRAWQRALERTLRPWVRVFNVAGVAVPTELVKGPVAAGAAVACVCRGTQCLPPIASLAEIEREIAS
ncbi:MAG: thioredoxin domain-containing protein [Betaproteobacteria bacterium]